MNLLKVPKAKIARANNGQLATVLNLFLAVLGVGVLGLFAFEMTRYLLARDELKTNVEVAALSCQTALVSSGDPTNATNQTNAQNAGLALFRQNSILGQSMAGATIAPSPSGMSPAPGQAQINFQFLDPITKLPVNTTSTTGVTSVPIASASAGTLIQAIGAYSYSPSFGQFIGLGSAQFTFQVSALSGVPKIDLIVLLDISGGMDNDTSISAYQRYQDTNGTDWMVPGNPTNGNAPATGLAYTILCDADLQALYPHQYEKIDGTGCVKVTYSESPGNANSNHLAGAGPGTPPGNYCPSSPPFSGSWLPESPNIAYQSTPVVSIFSHQTIAGLNEPLHKAIKGNHYFDKQLHSLIASNIKTANVNSINGLEKIKHIDLKTDRSLLTLCDEIISGSSKKDQLGQKITASQLDDKLSTISFAPQFYALQSLSSGSSGMPNPNPPITYIGTNNQTYCGASRVMGGGADVGPAVMPAVSGYCLAPPTGFGPVAPTVFTGTFVNGVVGAVSSDGTKSITCAATAIEAEGGHLESAAAATAAGIDVSANGLNITPGAGWFAFYYNTAKQYLEPYMAIVNSLIGFINELAIVSDVHYGFIAFNDNVGTDASSMSAPVNHVSQYFNYPTLNPDGTTSVASTYPLPNIPLSTSNSNQSTIIPILPTLSVWGNRNVTQALQTAYSQLQNNARPGANRAIVLVTCGAPNGADTPSAAISQAATIGNAGIPIYVVCAAIQPSDDANNDAAYSATGGSNGGIAAASAHGAQYYRVDFVDPGTTTGQLVSVFGNIARRLVSIMPGS